jgi:hypothetical protein
MTLIPGRFNSAMRAPRADLADQQLEVRRALIGPGLWPGPRRQARRVGGGSARKGGSRRSFLRSGICGAVRKDLRLLLRVEGPTRIMRGVQARHV